MPTNQVFREPGRAPMPSCEGCGAPTPQAELTFAPDGRQGCRRCIAGLSVMQAHQRATEGYGAGAKLLNPVAKAAMRNPRVFMRLLVLGIILLPVLLGLSVALASMFGEWLRGAVSP